MNVNLQAKENFFISCLILILLSLLAFPYLGNIGLWNPLEPRYSAIAKEIFQSGDWFRLRYIDNIYIEKPPHFFWLLNLSYLFTGGINVWASRLPSIIATFLSLAGLFLTGKKLFGDKIAWLATLIYLLNFRTIFQLRRIQVDAILVAIFIWGIYFLILALEKRENLNKRLSLFYIFLGLSILFKGLAAFVPIFLIMLITSIYIKQIPIKELGICRGLIITLLIVTTLWLIPSLLTGLTTSNIQTLLGVGVTRFLTVPSKHGPLYYFWVYLIEFLPWSLLFPISIISFMREKKRVHDLSFTPVIWFLVVLLFFMANSARHAVYIMPLYPASALIVAWYVVSAINKKSNIILPLFFKILSLALTLIPIFTYVAISLIKKIYIWNKDFTILSQFLNEYSISPLIFLLSILGATQIFFSLKPIHNSIWRIIGIFSIAVLSIALTYNGLIAPWLDKNKDGGDLAYHIKELPKGRPLVSYGELSLSESSEGILEFYGNRDFISVEVPQGAALEKLRNRPETIVLLLSKELHLLEEELKMPLYVAFADNIWRRTIVAASVVPMRATHGITASSDVIASTPVIASEAKQSQGLLRRAFGTPRNDENSRDDKK